MRIRFSKEVDEMFAKTKPYIVSAYPLVFKHETPKEIIELHNKAKELANSQYMEEAM